MLHCVVAFSCFCTFYASPTSLVVFVEKFYSLYIVSALIMVHKLRYDTLPHPQDRNAGVWPSCIYGTEMAVLART